MHSQLHDELYRVLAADRVRNAPRAALPKRRQHPPPIRGRAAYAAARLARRLDSRVGAQGVTSPKASARNERLAWQAKRFPPARPLPGGGPFRLLRVAAFARGHGDHRPVVAVVWI